MNGEIRIIKEQKRYLDEKLAEAIYKNNKHDVEQIKLEIKLLETKQQTAKSLRDVYKFKAETLRPIKEAQLSVQTETSPLVPLAPKSPYDSTPSDALFQDRTLPKDMESPLIVKMYIWICIRCHSLDVHIWD